MANDATAIRTMAFKADMELSDRIDAHLERMHRNTPGVTFVRSDAIRNLLLSGLDEAEAGERKRKKKGA